MASHNKKDLPSWATVSSLSTWSSKPSSQEPLSLPDEEASMRVKSYHAWNRVIDASMFHALTTVTTRQAPESVESEVAPFCTVFLQELDALLRRTRSREASEAMEVPGLDMALSTTTASSATTTTTTATIHNNSVPTSNGKTTSKTTPFITADILRDYSRSLSSTVPSACFDHRSLPVLLLNNCPFLTLDRSVWMRRLVQTTKRARAGSVIVWLRPMTGTSLIWSDIIEEIVEQCLEYGFDDNAILGNMGRTSQNKSKKSKTNDSDTDRLLHWASLHTNYDSILVFAEDAQGYERDLIHWLSDRRANHGLPFCCVLLRHCAMPWEIPLSHQGPFGCLLHAIDMPRSEDVMDAMWMHLVENRDFPWYLLSSEIMQELAHGMTRYHGSFVQATIDLRAVVAQLMSLAGAFYTFSSLLLNTPFQSPSDSLRLSWYIVHPRGAFAAKIDGNELQEDTKSEINPLLAWLAQVEEHHQRCKVAFALLKAGHQLQTEAGKHSGMLCFSLATFGNDHGDAFTMEMRKSLLETLYALRDGMTMNSNQHEIRLTRLLKASFVDENIISRLPSADKSNQQMRDCINELIVLVDSCATVSDVYNCVNHIVEQAATRCNKVMHVATTLDCTWLSLTAQPRRHTTQALLDSNESLKSKKRKLGDDDFSSPGLVYRAMQDRLSLGINEWFSDFKQLEKHSGDNRPDARMRFGYGIYALKQMGLVTEKKATGKSESMFDKSAIVWCSGD
jgi:hypothetical protein